MRPYIVTEPITRLRWVATTPGSALLARLPTFCVVAAFALGFFIGYIY